MWEVLLENERLSTKQQLGQVFTCMKGAILLRKNKPNFWCHQMCVHLRPGMLGWIEWTKLPKNWVGCGKFFLRTGVKYKEKIRSGLYVHVSVIGQC